MHKSRRLSHTNHQMCLVSGNAEPSTHDLQVVRGISWSVEPA